MEKENAASRIIKKLVQAGYEAFLAGGCVRDKIRGVSPKDFDIATSASPEVVQRLFKRTIPVGAKFGVILVVESETPFEVATFRSDGLYQDGRRPEAVEFSSLEEDAKRRDFTINGLYYNIHEKRTIDLVGGEADLKSKVIRTIGSPERRFREDHLRMLRAVRFAVQLGFSIEKETLEAISPLAPLIAKVSQERIRDELIKIFSSPNPLRGVELLDQLGLLKIIIPEMETLKGVEQPQKYHPEGDVWVHTLMLIEGLHNSPIELVMGALLHDIAKPATFVRAPDRIRFNGHDKLGAEMSRVICKRLAFSNQQTDLICELVALHLRFKDVFQMRTSTLKRFLSLPHFDLHLELHRLDCLASHQNLEAYEFCQKTANELKKEPPPPLKLVKGRDLIRLGFTPGPLFKKIITKVEDAILEGEVKTKKQALEFVNEKFSPQKKAPKKRPKRKKGNAKAK